MKLMVILPLAGRHGSMQETEKGNVPLTTALATTMVVAVLAVELTSMNSRMQATTQLLRRVIQMRCNLAARVAYLAATAAAAAASVLTTNFVTTVAAAVAHHNAQHQQSQHAAAAARLPPLIPTWLRTHARTQLQRTQG